MRQSVCVHFCVGTLLSSRYAGCQPVTSSVRRLCMKLDPGQPFRGEPHLAQVRQPAWFVMVFCEGQAVNDVRKDPALRCFTRRRQACLPGILHALPYPHRYIWPRTYILFRNGARNGRIMSRMECRLANQTVHRQCLEQFLPHMAPAGMST
jgi:hypothetical protein